MNRRRRVSAAAVTGILLITSLLAACSANSSSTGASGSAASGSQGAATAADDPENANLTYWSWMEGDAPGADAWMKERVAEYAGLHPGVKIDLVPQSSDTLIGAFTTAAQTNSGPDIATQWATLPVLTPAWAGAVAPLDDLTLADTRSTWIGTQENTDQGKLWAMPIYLIGIPMAYNKNLFAKAGIAQPPATFDELLTACGKLKAAGITPIGAGNKDGSFGAWFFSNFGMQNLDNPSDLKNAIVGTSDIADPKYMGYLTALEKMMSGGCFNNDIASITGQEGFAKFNSGEAAMMWAPDGQVVQAAKALGADRIGVVKTPTWGTGKLANAYNTTQSSSVFITSWSEHPRAAAQFLTWLHNPANLKSWYAATEVFPADTTFDASMLTSDLTKALWALDSSPGSVWLENYLPPSLDTDGARAAGQVVTSGGTAAKAADMFVKATEKWRTQNPAEVESYTAWAVR